MQITKEQLSQLIPKNPYLDQWYEALSVLLPDYEINTPNRIAAFMLMSLPTSQLYMRT